MTSLTWTGGLYVVVSRLRTALAVLNPLSSPLVLVSACFPIPQLTRRLTVL